MRMIAKRVILTLDITRVNRLIRQTILAQK